MNPARPEFILHPSSFILSLFALALLASAARAQTTSTRCQTTEVKNNVGIIDLQLVGCGDGFPDNVLWHLDRADSLSGSLDFKFTRKATGKGAVVYLLDTGVMRDHDEFTRADGSVVIGGLSPGGLGKCPSGHDPAVEPCYTTSFDLPIYTHGTATASIVAGRNTGVAPDAKIVSVWMMSVGLNVDLWIKTFNAIITHAFDPATPQFKTGIISISFSVNYASVNDPKFPAFEQKVRQMIAGVDANGNPDPAGKRFLFVTIAGNYGTGQSNQCNADMSSNLYPAVLGGIDGFITVGGIDEKNQVWDRTCRGDAVDVFAPAANLLIASIGGHDHYESGHPPPGSEYATNSGTSFSAPYVAGLAALLLEKNPNLTPVELERIIKGSPSHVSRAYDATAAGRVAVFDWVTPPAERHRAARP